MLRIEQGQTDLRPGSSQRTETREGYAIEQQMQK